MASTLVILRGWRVWGGEGDEREEGSAVPGYSHLVRMVRIYVNNIDSIKSIMIVVWVPYYVYELSLKSILGITVNSKLF